MRIYDGPGGRSSCHSDGATKPVYQMAPSNATISHNGHRSTVRAKGVKHKSGWFKISGEEKIETRNGKNRPYGCDFGLSERMISKIIISEGRDYMRLSTNHSAIHSTPTHSPSQLSFHGQTTWSFSSPTPTRTLTILAGSVVRSPDLVY